MAPTGLEGMAGAQGASAGAGNGGVPGLRTGGGPSGVGGAMQRNMDPQFIESMMNNPMVQSMMSNPQFMD